MKGLVLAGMLAVASITPCAQAGKPSCTRKVFDGVTSWPMRLMFWLSFAGLGGYSIFGVYMFYAHLEKESKKEPLIYEVVQGYMDEHHLMRLIYFVYTMCGLVCAVSLSKSGQALWDGPGRWMREKCWPDPESAAEHRGLLPGGGQDSAAGFSMRPVAPHLQQGYQ